jgi:hypothetical protein
MHQPCTDAPAPPRRPPTGVGVTLWTGGDLAAALPASMRNLLAECRPQIVCPHGGPTRLAGAVDGLVREARALVPGVRIHVGVGCDVWLADAIAGRVSEETAVAALATAGVRAAELGAEAAIYDAEAACKLSSLVTFRVMRAVFARVRDRAPALIIGHTAYDHPTLHSDDADGVYDDRKVKGEYAWRTFCADPLLGADWEVRQVYCAPEQPAPTAADPHPAPVFASAGALRRRLESSDRSFARATELGWVHPQLPIDNYHQLHHTPFAQIATVGCESRVVLGWCGPRLPAGRMDISGEYALRLLCAMERAGIRDPAKLAAWQQARRITIDKVAGRQVAATLGIHVPAGRAMIAAWWPSLADAVHFVDDDGACRAAIVAGVQQHGDAPADADLVVLDARPPDGLPNVRPVLNVPRARHDARDPPRGTWHHRRDCVR